MRYSSDRLRGSTIQGSSAWRSKSFNGCKNQKTEAQFGTEIGEIQLINFEWIFDLTTSKPSCISCILFENHPWFYEQVNGTQGVSEHPSHHT